MMSYTGTAWELKRRKNFRGGVVIPYEVPLDSYLPFKKKIIYFLGYVRFVRRIINQNHYEKLIVLTTQTAIPLYGMLCGEYRGRYIYDYRDVTKENKIPGYKFLVQNLIRNSYCTMISSRGFLREIGMKMSEKIQLDHNTRKAEKNSYSVRLNTGGSDPIRISFWGQVRQIDFNEWLCDQFGNDSRFRLSFHGGGDIQKLEYYCAVKEYKNIDFSGVYDLESIKKFAQDTDILHCIYQNDKVQTYAMPVKAYDAIKYKLPVLISKNSQVEKFYHGFSGAFAVEPGQEHLPDSIYKWYTDLNMEKINRGFLHLEEKVYKDDLEFEKTLRRFVGKGDGDE